MVSIRLPFSLFLVRRSQRHPASFAEHSVPVGKSLPLLGGDSSATPPAEPAAEAQAAPVTETPPVEEAPKEEDKPEEDKELPITRKEIAEGFASIFVPFTEKMNAQMTALEATVKELQGKLDTVDKSVKDQGVMSQSPVASLAAMFAAESASRSKATQVPVEDPLVNMKPKERQPDSSKTGIPFIDSMLTAGRQ